MVDLILWMILIPAIVMAAKFWLNTARLAVRHKRGIARRVQRVRSALSRDE